MKNRPLPVLIVALLMIIVGLVGFIYHLKDFSQSDEKTYAIVLVELLRIAAFVAGILLLRAMNLGRWLTIAWVLSHVIISALNSMSEMIAHMVILVIVSILLFLPKSSFYFRKRML